VLQRIRVMDKQLMDKQLMDKQPRIVVLGESGVKMMSALLAE
jgi:hypothetical protein